MSGPRDRSYRGPTAKRVHHRVKLMLPTNMARWIEDAVDEYTVHHPRSTRTIRLATLVERIRAERKKSWRDS